MPWATAGLVRKMQAFVHDGCRRAGFARQQATAQSAPHALPVIRTLDNCALDNRIPANRTAPNGALP
jgi:hypothetical protein